MKKLTVNKELEGFPTGYMSTNPPKISVFNFEIFNNNWGGGLGNPPWLRNLAKE